MDTHDDLCVAGSWETLEQLIRQEPLSAVVFNPAADGTMDVARACKLIRRFGSIPFVAYVPLDAPFARGIARMSNHGLRDVMVLRANDSPATFREILTRVSTIQELAAVVDALQPIFGLLPATLGRVLIDALRHPHMYASAEAIATAAGMTVSALYRAFRSARLNSPKRFVVGAHVFRGYLYLKDIGFTIRDISAKLGYTHPRIFAHQTECVLGETPSKIRHSLELETVVQRLVAWISSCERTNGVACLGGLPRTSECVGGSLLAVAFLLLTSLSSMCEAQLPLLPQPS